MRVGETELEMVQRHVREGEIIVSRQHDLIADLKLRKMPIDQAEKLLFNFETTLLAHHDHLYRLNLK